MITLTAQPREVQGKKVQNLRTQGLVPAVLYGPKIDAISIQVSEKEFEKVYAEAGESTLVSLAVEGKEASPVLIYEVQRNPLSGKVVHTDFYQTPLDRKIEINVPLVFEGVAPAVAEFEGTLMHTMQEVEVRALPQELPSEIVVNVEGLKTFEDRVTIKDLVKTDAVEFVRGADEIVAQVVPVTVEEEIIRTAPQEEEATEGETAKDGEDDSATETSQEESKEK